MNPDRYLTRDRFLFKSGSALLYRGILERATTVFVGGMGSGPRFLMSLWRWMREGKIFRMFQDFFVHFLPGFFLPVVSLKMFCTIFSEPSGFSRTIFWSGKSENIAWTISGNFTRKNFAAPEKCSVFLFRNRHYLHQLYGFSFASSPRVSAVV